jgi:hypothetical protein
MSTVQAAPPRNRHRTRDGRTAPRSESLCSYTDPRGFAREIVSRRGADGSRLVIDRLAHTLGDERLLAHLSADEPIENARIVSALYLADERRPRCRRLASDDLKTASSEGHAAREAASSDLALDEAALTDRHGRTYRLAVAPAAGSIPELHWYRDLPGGGERAAEVITVREAVGCLERYEPVCSLSGRAVDAHRGDPNVSVTELRVELERVRASPIVLNRGIREAVLRAIKRGEVTMSEIAIRCCRVKRAANGNESGETSWLARRIGTLPASGQSAPTAWVHTDVLALIARQGLGVAPREVEVDTAPATFAN